MRRSAFTSLFVLALNLALSGSVGAETDKKAFFAADLHKPMNDSRVYSVGDDAGTMSSGLGTWPDKICSSTADPICDFKGVVSSGSSPKIRASPMLTICSEQANNDCIESIEISRDGGNFRKLVFERDMPRVAGLDKDGKEFPADASMNLPRGSAASIWADVIDGQISDLKYLVSYQYSMYYESAEKKFILQNVQLGIRPFKVVGGNQWSSLYFTATESGVLYDFPENVQMRAVIHMSKSAAGWFKARLMNPDISISSLNSLNSRVEITGAPVRVPAFAYQRDLNNLSTDEKKYTGALKGVISVEPGAREIFDYIEMARKVVNDVAEFSNTYWTLTSTPWDNRNPCLQDSTRVLGIVSTNAIGYEGASPEFKDGFLNYRVTGIHFGPDGKTPNLGTYDLLLRSDAARCLYRFSEAPISATVSISGSDGSQNVATTVVSEKDGWLKMKAAGFTFSEKNIKVKLIQEKAAGVEAPKSALPAERLPIVKKTDKKQTITCVKGKVTKKVTSTAPVCPSGFKKR
ncbi:MAG: hypothetical protein NTV18_02090 [Actinobacteria bacterium]|nr:hypothetical protein [Actinomycetota bacterium]